MAAEVFKNNMKKADCVLVQRESDKTGVGFKVENWL